ncbi:MAG: hypothetical protein JST80_00145 [Bdellovibrionales bacterium]|nr:hypothetical protein [Bdellovibrionales bacterium]
MNYRCTTLTMLALLMASMMPQKQAQAAPADELLVNSYLNEQAARRMEQIVPKGEYTIHVNAILRKADSEEHITLPFASTPITMSDVVGKAGGLNIESLLGRIHHYEIDLSLTKNVPNSVKAMMQSALYQQFALKPARGDRLNIIDLPAEFELPWIYANQEAKTRDKEKDKAASSETEVTMPSMQSIIMVVGAVAFAIILLGIIISFVFSRHSSRISESLREAADQVQSIGPTNSPMGASAQTAAQAEKMETASSSAFSSQTSQEFWESVPPAAIAAFCVDTGESKIYRAIPGQLLSVELPNTLADQVKTLLPQVFSELHFDETQALVDTGTLRSVFKKYQSDYKKLAQNELGAALLRIGVKQVMKKVAEKKESDTLLIMTQLTPVRKNDVIRQLPTAMKVKIAKLTLSVRQSPDWSTQEKAMVEEFKTIRPKFDLDAAGAIEMISKSLLQASSFEEDELLYQEAQNNPNFPYVSALEALDALESIEWESMNLQEVAFAFFGYSENVVESVKAKFAGKKLEWLQSFLKKAVQQSYLFDQAEIQNAQHNVKERVKAKRNVGASESSANAS